MPYIMPQKEERIAKLNKELEKAIKAVIPLNPQKVVLFGSLSRGDVGSNSDIDLLIVWDTDLPFMQRLQIFYDAIKPDVAMDILVYTPSEIENLKDTNPFIHQVLKEGKILYEK